jgi:hypothetical protein
MPAVTVNLNVSVDAQGQIEVFGAPPVAPTGELIVSLVGLSSEVLFKTTGDNVDNAMIMFWEPSAELGNIYASLASGDYRGDGGFDFTLAKAGFAKKGAEAIEKMLCNGFDCSAANVFNKYASQDSHYWNHSDFGRVVLSAHAEDIFGHPAATAAITNDEALMKAMLSVSAGCDANGTAAQRYGAWTKDVTTDAATWSIASSTSDANLAVRIIKKLLKKGEDIAISAVTTSAAGVTSGDDTLANIVKQVIGQDATRAMDQDNNELPVDKKQALRFYPGDVVYMNINIEAPSMSYASGQLATITPGQLSDVGARNFVIKAELN